MQTSARRRRAGLILGLVLLLGGCAHNQSFTEATAANDPDINVYPANYKPEILSAMHAYLNDPTGIREAAISAPALKVVGAVQRFVVCLRFNARKRANEYAGAKEVAAVFMVGRFDRFVETGKGDHQECAGAAYVPFPELEKLPR
jgi:hypothetical protein